MKEFIGTTVFRLIVLLGGWIYMSNYKSEALYNFLNLSNPATKAVTECYSGFASYNSGINDKLDTILEKISPSETGKNLGTTGTIVKPSTSGSSLNQIYFASGSKQ